MDKLELMRQWGFSADHVNIAAELAGPRSSPPGYMGRVIRQLHLDDGHALRVVYEENGEVAVITIYPARQDRYED